MLSRSSLPWSPNKGQLMTLSRADLCNLIPSTVPPVKKDNNKDQICDIIIENWSDIVVEASLSGSSSSEGGGRDKNRRGYGGSGDDDKGDENQDPDEPDAYDPADYGMGDFYLTVQTCFGGSVFKNFLVNGTYTIGMVKVLCSQEWKMNPRHQRVLYNDNDVFDTSTLNELSMDHTSVLKLGLRGLVGGAGFLSVRKPHLKKDDAINVLKAEQKKPYETKAELVIPDSELPQSFCEFLEGEKAKMDDIVFESETGRQLFEIHTSSGEFGHPHHYQKTV